MPPAVKTLGSVAAAIAMVVAAVLVRGALDTKKVRDDLRLTVVCDPLSEAFCRAAEEADARLTIRVERPDATTEALVGLPLGRAPDFQAWVTVGPWLQMADGGRPGQPPFEKAVTFVASTPLVLVTNPNQNLAQGCAKPIPAACLPLPRLDVGLPSPKSNGVGLAGLAQVVMAATGTPPADLDLASIESGPASSAIDRLRGRTNPNAGREQVNARFTVANPIVTTQVAARDYGAAQVVKSEPAVRAVLQIGILDSRATAALGDEPAGRGLARAALTTGWDPPGDPTGGLPEPGVLAALKDAWTGA